MQIALLPSRTPENFHPITEGRELGDCPIANVTLRRWITAELTRAGFDVMTHDFHRPGTVLAHIDNWIDTGALCMLARAERGTALFDKNNELLAWKGRERPEDCPARLVTEAEVLRLRHPWDLLNLNENILSQMEDSEILGTISPHAEVRGLLHLGEGSEVLPGVLIEGPVVIGKNCRIGPNCHIRGNTAIGDGCIVGNGAELKNSILFPRCYFPHYGYIGDSIIGSHVHIGAGTIIANSRHDGRTHYSAVGGHLIDTGRTKFGTIIGDGVHTGINTTIYPGRKIGRGRTTLPLAVVTDDLL